MISQPESRSSPRGVQIPAGAEDLPGLLRTPPKPRGIVLFAHGSGSSRFSARNQFVADALHEAGLATLLFDLLTPREAQSRANVFDVEFLAERLEDATIWQRDRAELRDLPLGYFGASTGAAAALIAAARMPGAVRAIVSRGGRPDLARDCLPLVQAPTLLIVGENDRDVVELNRGAWAALRCERELTIIPGASHLFPEAGALQQVARRAVSWLTRWLSRPPSDGSPPTRSCAADGTGAT